MKKLLLVLVCVSGCASTVVVRGSSSDYLQKKGTMVTVNAPSMAVDAELDRLFGEYGFAKMDTQPGEAGATVHIYKGGRRVNRQAQDYGIQLGSWFAARVRPEGNQTTLTLIGKPMIGAIELCSDADSELRDIKYTCTDTQVPRNWMAMNLVTGRDEETVVSYVLEKVYERLK